MRGIETSGSELRNLNEIQISKLLIPFLWGVCGYAPEGCFGSSVDSVSAYRADESAYGYYQINRSINEFAVCT
jgi:hypothetical protein